MTKTNKIILINFKTRIKLINLILIKHKEFLAMKIFLKMIYVEE